MSTTTRMNPESADVPLPDEFTIKDSGSRAEFDGGMVRDTEDGKIDWSNLFFGPMARRLARHLTKGREKYPDPEPGIPNWTLGQGIAVWLRARRSFLRHQDAWLCGLKDEDHAAAMEFNINLKEYIEERLDRVELEQVRAIEEAHANQFPQPCPYLKPPIMFGEKIPEGRVVGDCDMCGGDRVACDCALEWVPAPFTGTPYNEDDLTAADVAEIKAAVREHFWPSPAVEGCGGNCDSPFADPPLEELEKGLNPFKKRCCGPKYVSAEAIKAGSLWCPHCSALLLRGAATWDCPTHGPILNHEDVK